MKLKTTLLALALAAAGFVGGPASAGVATGQFTVSLTIEATCQVATSGSSNIALGSVDAGQVPATSNGTFTVSCSSGTPYNVGLLPSGGASDGTGDLSGPGGTIAYALFQNAATTTPWGNTATSSSVGNGEAGTGSGMGAGGAETFTAYAKTTGSTDVPPGTYTDTVTVNVNF